MNTAESRVSRLSAEVPGTPEQVWEAIATGPGISTWFVPAEVEQRLGGAVVLHLGEDESWDSTGEVVGWEPPHRFAFVERWRPHPDASEEPVATEFLVEARSGGTCVVHLVTSGFGSGQEWDDAVESIERGWPPYLRILRLHLRAFAGRTCSTVRALRPVERPAPSLARDLLSAFPVVDGDGVQRVSSTQGTPVLAGRVEHRTADQILVLLDEPAEGAALIGAFPSGQSAMVLAQLHLYGEDARALAAREEPRWRAWLAQRTSS